MSIRHRLSTKMTELCEVRFTFRDGCYIILSYLHVDNRVFSFVWVALKKESSPYRLQQIF